MSDRTINFNHIAIGIVRVVAVRRSRSAVNLLILVQSIGVARCNLAALMPSRGCIAADRAVIELRMARARRPGSLSAALVRARMQQNIRLLARRGLILACMIETLRLERGLTGVPPQPPTSHDLFHKVCQLGGGGAVVQASLELVEE